MYTKTIKSEYDIQAENFINKHCLTIKKNFMACKPYFENEKESRNVYHITIRDTRAKKEIYFDFGASIVDTKKGITPSDYTILAGLYTDTGDSFEDFCSCFGYEEDSRSSYDTYLKCKELDKKLKYLFTQEQLSELQEIQ